MIALASDHGGFLLKEHLKNFLTQQGREIKDFGCFDTTSCDYPDFAAPAAQAVASGVCETGILVCTTGIGVSMVANKAKGVRCALCADPLSAEMTRRHNNANILALGAGMIGVNLAERIVEVFLSTPFDAGRHQRRLDKLAALEQDS